MRLSERLARDKRQYQELPDRNSKITFLWDYYKIPILAVLSVLFILLIALVNNAGRKEVSMYVVLLNNDSVVAECDPSVFDRVLEQAGYDVTKKQANVNVSYSLGNEKNESADIETLQVLTALFTVSDLDLYVAPKEYFDHFAVEDGFADLSALIDTSLLDKNQEDLYYCHTSSGKDVLAGIVLHEGSLIHEAGYYHDDVIIGAVGQGEHLEEAVAFIRELMK